jgi:hypothetical protein
VSPKPVPVTVSTVLPVRGDDNGETDTMLTGSVYVNVDVGDSNVNPLFVTETVVEVAIVDGGAMHEMEVEEMKVAGDTLESKAHAREDVGRKLLPVTVTTVPPLREPFSGETPRIDTATVYSNAVPETDNC